MTRGTNKYPTGTPVTFRTADGGFAYGEVTARDFYTSPGRTPVLLTRVAYPDGPGSTHAVTLTVADADLQRTDNDRD